jgi:hypothetical protein
MAKERENEPVINPSAPAPIIQMPLDQMEALMASAMAAAMRMSQTSAPDGGGENAMLKIALEGLRASVAATEQLGNEIKRTVRRSNAGHSHASAFNLDPRCSRCLAGEPHEETGNMAHPKPALKHETFFCYMPQKADALTPVEVELFNAFTESTESRFGTWTATLERLGKSKTRLHVKVPCLTNDDLSTLPSMEVILLELLYGDRAVNPVLAMERIKDLEAQMAALTAQLAARPSSGT